MIFDQNSIVKNRILTKTENSIVNGSSLMHYENLPMRYTEIFLALKIENFQLKIFDIFLIFA